MSASALSRRSVLGAGVAAIGGATLWACTSRQPGQAPHPAPSSAPPSRAPTASPAAAFGLAPLTGLPATAAGLAARPAVAVDVYLDGGAPAPLGLDVADLVFEEVTGRGARRLMAVYQSRDSALVGPVAETWPSDVRTLPVLRALVASRGGPSKFSTVLASTDGITDVSYPSRGTAYTRRPGAREPYDLYTSTGALYRLAPAGAPAPPGFLPFQEHGLPLASTGIVAAGRLTLTVPGEPARAWSYDATLPGWRRAGSAIAFTNLVVLVMPYRTVATSSRGGSIRTAEVFGSGPGWVAAGGSAVPCTWSRKGAFSASLLVDHGGYPVRVLPGGTWVCYAPAGTTVSIGS